MTVQQKRDAMQMFLHGHNITDVSAFFAERRSDIETVLREALVQLSELVVTMNKAADPEATEIQTV